MRSDPDNDLHDIESDLPDDPFQTEPVTKLRGRRKTYLLAAMLVVVLILIWQFVPPAIFEDVDAIEPWFKAVSRSDWAAFYIALAYIAAGLSGFPMTILIAITGLLYGPVYGGLYGLLGSLLAAVILFALGQHIGQTRIRALLGQRVERLCQQMSEHGVWSVTLLHYTPIAPFTMINLVAGYSRMRFMPFFLGSIFGLVPPIIVINSVSDQFRRFLDNPDPFNMIMLIILTLALIALVHLMRHALGRRRKREEEEETIERHP